jgi:hypothetical protein
MTESTETSAARYCELKASAYDRIHNAGEGHKDKLAPQYITHVFLCPLRGTPGSLEHLRVEQDAAARLQRLSGRWS